MKWEIEIREGIKRLKNKKLKLFSVCTAFLAFIALTAFLFVNTNILKVVEIFSENNCQAKNLVVVDPGHGGFDPGAVSGDIKESVINLQIARKLKEYFEMFGFKVLLTRSTEDDLSEYNKKAHDLKKRKEIVLENNPQVFISIHLNSFPVSKYFGAQVFYDKSNEEAKKLALFVQNELRYMPNGLVNRRQPKPIDVYILKNLKIPAILIECGFMSNKMELSLLQNHQYQDWLSYSILKGVLSYLDQKKEMIKSE
ncbi:N-acetylmuramoyl-L-alanine amidase [Caldicellulosiruptor bescii]|uniref:Cell wall hydrolase/autolysin n=2 Tax=Caldicellulosiruptor bescii TaxID=31899 RepID=B9MNN3_CALBD|nr:N-acetylmuramoyl-L-alanine amidase [Caldicellulosiruptor bescii]ACM59562.1 cell wall hydrolase/autolysin [Caldicellulosiruptor bescii DSM 6725]PBC89590.1 N-acetylmuramoyl-L-alanine amidase [Caldicellulosiruptor bescii]PBC89913.1 N-acetylmuramoyl-L-alanine amidase [Caldicellulosiruptor bescii]PBD04660.1 N-acetylmuramoyl-L-alanine amidase [Caldicellulosiruptor bescii]PBD05709.1 N-acetylmuramoyl-L-alanine amidase [Caldicellulosiruptor bescii]